MTKGDRVRMSEVLKQRLRLHQCDKHVEEFGDCIGIVEGLVDYGNQLGPELDVRWQPSQLRYGYHPNDLDLL